MFKYNIRLFLVVSFCLFSSISFSEITDAQQGLLDKLPPDQRDSIREKMEEADNIQSGIEETFKQSSTLIQRPELKTLDQLEPCEECIYGYEFFIYSPSTFAPSNNIPISSTYVLGPGDKLGISYFGRNKEQYEGYISREGILTLPLLAPVNLLGMNYNDAVVLIKRRVETELLGTNVSVTLKDLRSNSIYLLGQAYKPGNYTMSGLSTVTNALFVSGGVNKLGSLRNIEIRRGGEVIKVYDFYEFLLEGKTDSDIRLQDGDIVFIPYIQKKVKVGGAFKGPHLYEVKDGETIRDIIDLAGGVKSEVSSNEKLEFTSFNIDTNKRFISYLSQNSDDLDKQLNDGDAINISKSISLKTGTIKITGEVHKSGEYTILEGDRILDVIERAGGYSDDSFPEGAIFLRKDVAILEKEGFERAAKSLEDYVVNLVSKGSKDITTEAVLMPITRLVDRLREEVPMGRQVVDVNYLQLKTDPLLNFRIQDGDSLYIPKRPESISIVGEVFNPSIQRYTSSLTINEYINLAGGLKDVADTDKIFIVQPNGETLLQNRRLFSKYSLLIPGSTIVVTRESYSGIELASVLSPILASFATSAAAIAILGRTD